MNSFGILLSFEVKTKLVRRSVWSTDFRQLSAAPVGGEHHVRHVGRVHGAELGDGPYPRGFVTLVDYTRGLSRS